MKYIMTGGAGFIGSNLARALSHGHEATIIKKIPTTQCPVKKPMATQEADL